MSSSPVYVDNFRVTFDEADPAGIAFFAHSYTYAHRAYEAYMRSLGFHDHFSAEEYSVPIVRSECDHRGPLKLGESLATEVFVERVGVSSLNFRFVITDGELICAEVTFVSVFVAVDSFDKTPVPDRIRAALEPVALQADLP